MGYCEILPCIAGEHTNRCKKEAGLSRQINRLKEKISQILVDPWLARWREVYGMKLDGRKRPVSTYMGIIAGAKFGNIIKKSWNCSLDVISSSHELVKLCHSTKRYTKLNVKEEGIGVQGQRR